LDPFESEINLLLTFVKRAGASVGDLLSNMVNIRRDGKLAGHLSAMLDRTIDRKLERRPVSLILAQHRG
jgi:hypothetical protein